MKFRRIVLTAITVLFPVFSGAADFASLLSLEGFTGVINTPNAETTPEGHVDLSVNNQLESQFVGIYPDGHNFMFSLGALPYVELGGRLAVRNDASRNNGYIIGGNRDLSVNMKITVPFKHEHLPTLAFGAQDFGGAATNFSSNYLVASQIFGPLRVNLGYGSGPNRMDGIFGSAELRTWSWLYLLAENDGDESNIGLRLTTPRPLLGKIETSFTAKLLTTGAADDVALGLTLRIPLGNAHHNQTPLPAPVVANNTTTPTPTATQIEPPVLDAPAPPTPATTTSEPSATESDVPVIQINNQTPSQVNPLDRIARRLADLGFQNLRIGTDDVGTMYVQFENIRYNHNFLDGMGLVLGVMATMAAPEIQRIEALATKRQIAIMRVGAPAALYRAFLTDPAPALAELRSSMHITRASDFSSAYIYWRDIDASSTRTWVDVVLRPDLSTRVGTEYGTFDYSLALRTDARLNLWTGALLNTTWDVPVSNSSDVEPGHPYSNTAYESGLKDVLLQQLLPVTSTMTNLTSVGWITADAQNYIGGWNETTWNPRSGAHNLRTKLGYFNGENGDDVKMWVGYYNVMWAPKDIVFEVSYGQYWYGDHGLTLIARRFFGDTAVSTFFKYTGDKAAGLSFSIPLTPRRDLKPGVVQLRGTPRWAYELQTSINLAPTSNPVNTRINVDRNPYYTAFKDVLDSGRLNALYVRQHVSRLRDAYVKWGMQ